MGRREKRTGKLFHILIPNNNLTSQRKDGMHTKALKSKGLDSQMLVEKPPLPEGTQLPF